LLLALVVRLIALDTRILWYDEAFAVLFSETGLERMLYGTLTPVNGAAADVHPLLYYTTLNGWMGLFGQSPAMVRLWSVLLGMATVLALFLLARDLWDDAAGLWTAFVVALAPFHVQYSQEVRMYALLGLLLVLTTWCYVRGGRTGKLAYWVGFGVLAGLSMYTQQLAAFYLAALGLLPFVQRRRDLIVRVCLSAGLAVLIYLPWLVNLPAQLGKVGTYWVLKPDLLVSPLLSLWNFVFVELEVRDQASLVASMITLALVLILLLVTVFAPRRQKRADRSALLLAVWLVAAPMAMMLLVSMLRPVYLTRGLQGSALLLYVAIGYLLSHARLPGGLRALLISAWIVSSALGLYHLYLWDRFPRPRFDQAWRYLTTAVEGDDVRVVHANKLTMLPIVYYARHADSTGALTQRYVGDIPGSGQDTLGLPTQEALGLLAEPCVAVAAGGAGQVWLVIFEQQLTELGGSTPETEWLDTHYRRLSTIPVNDLHLILYDQPDETAKAAQCK
jgi:4-amino-4-deoxy-L-arabinose transferase-like glycosyltransferase